MRRRLSSFTYQFDSTFADVIELAFGSHFSLNLIMITSSVALSLVLGIYRHFQRIAH